MDGTLLLSFDAVHQKVRYTGAVRILFTRFPLESARGGAEIQTVSLMKGLRKRKHEVAFLGSCPVLLAWCREEGIPVIPLEIGPPPVTKWHAVSFAWRRASMRRLLIGALGMHGNVDAVCMLSLSEKLLVTDWLAARGTRVLWIEHDRIGRWLRQNPWLRRLRRLSLQATTVGVSELSRKIYLALGWPSDRTMAIPNGIDPARIGKPSRSGHAEDGFLRLGCVSRLSREKGIDVLLDAIKALPDVTLDIAGEGPERERIAAAIQDLGAGERHETDFGKFADASRARLFGRVENLADFYATHDVIVLPSREHDPFGLAAAEAMLLGIPVVVTDACGIASYLTDGRDAIVVRAHDAAALRDGIHRLRDPALRKSMGAAAKKTAIQLFALQRMVDAYDHILSSPQEPLQSAIGKT